MNKFLPYIIEIFMAIPGIILSLRKIWKVYLDVYNDEIVLLKKVNNIWNAEKVELSIKLIKSTSLLQKQMLVKC